MKKQQYNILIWMIIGWVIISLAYRKAAYSDMPMTHKIGTTDDAIRLIGSQPVSPLLTESVTYEFLDTLARMKGAKSVDALLITDFPGMTVNQVTTLFANLNVDELIQYLQAQGYPEPAIDQFEKELLLNKDMDSIRKEGTGIDCTKCKWKQHTTTTPEGRVVNSGIKQCVYEGDGYEVDCNPGICNPINGVDPWSNEDPWTPSATLQTSWGCSNGKVSFTKGKCLAYDKDDPTECIETERIYSDYVPTTPVLNK